MRSSDTHRDSRTNKTDPFMWALAETGNHYARMSNDATGIDHEISGAICDALRLLLDNYLEKKNLADENVIE